MALDFRKIICQSFPISCRPFLLEQQKLLKTRYFWLIPTALETSEFSYKRGHYGSPEFHKKTLKFQCYPISCGPLMLDQQKTSTRLGTFESIPQCSKQVIFHIIAAIRVAQNFKKENFSMFPHIMILLFRNFLLNHLNHE